MLFRRIAVGAWALAAATPALAHGPGHDHGMSGGRPADAAKVTRTANLDFACDIPGHYEDGMHGPVSFAK